MRRHLQCAGVQRKRSHQASCTPSAEDASHRQPCIWYAQSAGSSPVRKPSQCSVHVLAVFTSSSPIGWPSSQQTPSGEAASHGSLRQTQRPTSRTSGSEAAPPLGERDAAAALAERRRTRRTYSCRALASCCTPNRAACRGLPSGSTIISVTTARGEVRAPGTPQAEAKRDAVSRCLRPASQAGCAQPSAQRCLTASKRPTSSSETRKDSKIPASSPADEAFFSCSLEFSRVGDGAFLQPAPAVAPSSSPPSSAALFVWKCRTATRVTTAMAASARATINGSGASSMPVPARRCAVAAGTGTPSTPLQSTSRGRASQQI
mmetsp:Transcript_15396/g.42258  ORF Transcript_15396/g.42258 Transcript_15396/m.42258 type:complete len:319 (-) Transcript_15396:23-979(-)